MWIDIHRPRERPLHDLSSTRPSPLTLLSGFLGEARITHSSVFFHVVMHDGLCHGRLVHDNIKVVFGRRKSGETCS